MADDTRDAKPEAVDAALGDMKLEEDDASEAIYDTITVEDTSRDTQALSDLKRSRSSTPAISKSASQSPAKLQSSSPSPKSEVDEDEETIGGDITLTVEPGKAPKLSRKAPQKVASRPAPIFDHLEDVIDEATSVFQVIKDCIYGSKYMGYSEHDALDCDCSEEWSELNLGSFLVAY